jgi:hypothetical protein
MWVVDRSSEQDPATVLVEESVVTRPQVDAALRYHAAYADEIDARIELHRHETAAENYPEGDVVTTHCLIMRAGTRRR